MLKQHYVIKVLLAAVGGAACGIFLSTIIAALGYLIHDRPAGTPYLPLIMAALFAGIAALTSDYKGGKPHDKHPS